MIFSHTEFRGHERIVFVADEATGLRAIIAVHSTTLGPALGGCRCWSYETEDAGLTDVLRLSRGMTYKSSIAGVDLGGGKSVILLAKGQTKTPELIRSMGRAIEALGGDYIAGEDIGTGLDDMAELRRVTPHVLGAPAEMGGSGDPSPMTALGCFVGIETSVRYVFKDELRGRKVLVQGLGNVGGNLCRLLHEAGARLFVSDIRPERIEAMARLYGAESVSADAVYDADVDVFAPCAFGAIINDDTIDRMKCSIVAGGANNQLARDHHGDELVRRKILYAPDYVINGGGLIALAHERTGYDARVVEKRVRSIADTLTEIFERADAQGSSTHQAANAKAEERIANARKSAGAQP